LDVLIAGGAIAPNAGEPGGCPALGTGGGDSEALGSAEDVALSDVEETSSPGNSPSFRGTGAPGKAAMLPYGE